uniref:Uncharacterized protein n=1 Tax=Timema douglasi TaxID=61478 RepID=A0A7R8VAR6_TIMDO|nr:unnamed protein product [Timema douglasi]
MPAMATLTTKSQYCITFILMEVATLVFLSREHWTRVWVCLRHLRIEMSKSESETPQPTPQESSWLVAFRIHGYQDLEKTESVSSATSDRSTTLGHVCAHKQPVASSRRHMEFDACENKDQGLLPTSKRAAEN